jgi:hypothetical protein
MNSTPVPDAPSLDPSDPVLRQLASAVPLARQAAEEVAGPHEVGAHVGYTLEDAAACTHLFETDTPGYRGWRWAVTVASAGGEHDVTVSEVVLLPGPDALTAPAWVPWQERVQAGDLGVGDLMPTAPDDPRLVPGYLASDDDAVEDTAMEVGLGRVRVMSRAARLDAASRWRGGEFGPRSDMARGAPGHCVTCGFYLPLAGSLSAAFGVCGNEIAPADGHLVHAEYGCGAHSEAEVEQVSPVLVADLIYDDNAMFDIEFIAHPTAGEPAGAVAEVPVAEPEAEVPVAEAEAAVAEAEVLVEPVETTEAEVSVDVAPAEESAAEVSVEPVAVETAEVEVPAVAEVPADVVPAEERAAEVSVELVAVETAEVPVTEPEEAGAETEAPVVEEPAAVADAPEAGAEREVPDAPAEAAAPGEAEERPARERAPGGVGQQG